MALVLLHTETLGHSLFLAHLFFVVVYLCLLAKRIQLKRNFVYCFGLVVATFRLHKGKKNLISKKYIKKKIYKRRLLFLPSVNNIYGIVEGL